MNQKYLMGMASEGVQTIVFAAAAPNVAAFIQQNKAAPELTVCTLDYKMLLTARMGRIDACPDRAFSVNELLPVIVPMQTGLVQDVPLAAVPRESVQNENCPAPDWNYLHWAGYSNEKYQKIMDGSALLEYDLGGENIPMKLRIGQYQEGGGLALELVSWAGREPEDWEALTTNLCVPCEREHAFVNINNPDGQVVCQWIEKNDLDKATGRQQRSGFCTYPEYHFNPQRLKKLDREGYEKYLTSLQQRGRKSKSEGRHGR